MILQSFPYENLSDFVDTQQKNKGFQEYYSSLYEMQAQIYQESKPLREPSKKCQKLKREILTKWGSCFKEKLGREDRMDHPPIKLKLRKDRAIKPSFYMRPFYTPFHLRGDVRTGDQEFYRGQSDCSMRYRTFRMGIKSLPQIKG